MKLIRLLTLALFLFSSVGLKAQNQTEKGWSGETYVLASFYRLGSYSKERPTLFLEQNFKYRINKRFSSGMGVGINLYPAQLAFPVFINGQYHFKLKKMEWSITQYLGRNIKLSDVFFASNLYRGDLEMHINVKKITLNPKLGYTFLWDKYGGKNVGFYAGIGISYPFNFNRSNKP